MQDSCHKTIAGLRSAHIEYRYNLPHFQQLTSDPCVPGGAEDHSDLFSVNCKWMGVGVNG